MYLLAQNSTDAALLAARFDKRIAVMARTEWPENAGVTLLMRNSFEKITGRPISRSGHGSAPLPDLDGPNEFGPETSQEGALKSRVSVTGEEDRDRLGKESGRPDYGFRAHSRVEAGPAGRPSRDEQASEEDRATVVTLSTFRKQVGERCVSGARGRAGIVVPFPVRSVTWEW